MRHKSIKETILESRACHIDQFNLAQNALSPVFSCNMQRVEWIADSDCVSVKYLNASVAEEDVKRI